MPPGNYHVGIRAEGYSTRRTEVTVATAPVELNISIDFDMHFAEVLSVSPTARPQFESYQPTTVLDGQELTKNLEATIGATLSESPGVAMREFGNASARPVIRGLDGDRISVLEDGQRMGDLSSQSGDHSVPTNPAAARKIEVVRGPATFRATLGVRAYRHSEFEGEEIGTTFHNDTMEGEVLLSHKRTGRLVGSFGGWFLNRAFDAIGEEALSPPVDQHAAADLKDVLAETGRSFKVVYAMGF